MVMIQNRFFATGVVITFAHCAHMSLPHRKNDPVPHANPQRNFNVDNPNNTNIMVMIQNRITTCDSFHPPSS